MRCTDLMTSEVEVFREADTVQHVARRMLELDVGFAPICDREGRPVGTLTDRDIALRVCAADLSASGTPVRDVMTRGAVTCLEADGLDVAALERYCGEHLGKHKRPRQIEVVPELPKNFLGKVLRRKLRDAAK